MKAWQAALAILAVLVFAGIVYAWAWAVATLIDQTWLQIVLTLGPMALIGFVVFWKFTD